MTHHFPRSTVSVAYWCKICKKQTPHKVDDARLGACIACMERLELEHQAARPAAEVQAGLFDESEKR